MGAAGARRLLEPQVTLPFLEKLLQVLAQGGFTSTYKYAVLLGLIDLCVEAGQPPTSVTTTQLARRVVELYWPQVRPFDGKPLLNSAGKQAGIVSLIAAYIEDHGDIVSPGMAVLCDATGFADLLREVEWILIEYPLPRVQRVGPHHDAFIYEVNWDTTVSRSRFLRGKQRRSDFDNAIRFVDGAALELVRLAPVLVPLLRAEWTAKVSALNALAEARLAEHLFGRDRIDHSPLHRPLRSLQNGRCFYCNGSLSGGASQVDHFLPWSRYPDDGIDNLLLAHDRCNREKLYFLADIGFGHRWHARSLEQSGQLDEIASEVRWARDWTRTRGVVASVYQTVPDGVRLWAGEGNLRRVAIADLPAVHSFGRGLIATEPRSQHRHNEG